MATAPIEQGAALHQEALPDFILVRVDEVDEGERLRPVDPVRARGLAATLLKDGQDTAIQVCRLPGRNRWTLVAGAHRLAGAGIAGIEFLRAEVVTAERNARRLREIRENLFAPDLQPIDRAAFIAELVQIKRAQAGLEQATFRDASVKRAVRAEADLTMDTMSMVYGWSKEIGAELGFSDRTVRRDLEVYRRLPASVVEQLRSARHPILSNATQLRALAKLEPGEQARLVHTLVGVVVNGKVITSVAQARAVSGGAVKPVADPGAKRLSAFSGSFDRMSLAEKKAALQWLSHKLPAGFAIIEGERAAPAPAFPVEHERYREETLAAIDEAREIIDGIVEDDLLPGERGSDLRRVGSELQLARFTICGNGFALGASR